MGEMLFSEDGLNSIFNTQVGEARRLVMNLKLDELRDQAATLGVQAMTDLPSIELGEPVLEVGPSSTSLALIVLTLRVPYTGAPDLLTHRASTYTSMPPDGHATDTEIIVVREVPTTTPSDDVATWQRQAIESLKQQVGFANGDAAAFRATLVTTIDNAASARRDQLGNVQRLRDELGGV
jgi:hypothetical protein